LPATLAPRQDFPGGSTWLRITVGGARALKRSEDQTTEVHDRIGAVEDVAEASVLPGRGEQPGEETMIQAAVIVAVGAAAVAFVAGTGLYLYIRFTQHRRPPPGGEKRPPRP
jgi:hypothetical protein